MKYFDTMNYGVEDPTIEDLIAYESVDFEAMYEDEMFVEEMASNYEAELAYEGGYCG